MRRFRAQTFEDSFEPLPCFSARFHRAGHILGAASLHLRCGDRSVIFSGDLGRSDDLVMQPPEPPEAADVVLVESTYGNRLHGTADPLGQLADVSNLANGGTRQHRGRAVVCGGRAQALLHAIQQLKAARRIPDPPVYLNSPMAADVTGIFRQHASGHRLKPAEYQALCAGTKIVNTEEESRARRAAR